MGKNPHSIARDTKSFNPWSGRSHGGIADATTTIEPALRAPEPQLPAALLEPIPYRKPGIPQGKTAPTTTTRKPCTAEDPSTVKIN